LSLRLSPPRPGPANIGSWPEMTAVSAVAAEAARQLWAHEGLDAGAPEEMAAAAERGCARLRAGLTSWIGSDGYRALVDRALEQARAGHPALAGLQCQAGDVQGVAALVGAHGAAEVRESILALVALLIDLLSRVIGEEMAVRLVEQAWAGSARPAASATEGARDG
jgi:hypothetical protein